MIKSQKDFFSGLMFLVAGVAFAWGATNYTIGTGARMGPGYFPLLLGIVLAILGAVVTVTALVKGGGEADKIGGWAWKPLVFVIGANVVFGICLGGIKAIGFPSLGLVVGIYALVLVASLAADRYKIIEVLGLATVLALGSYLTFIVLLKLQIPVWPSFITG